MAKIKLPAKDEPKKLTTELPTSTIDRFLKYVRFTAEENGDTDMKDSEIQSIVLKEMINEFIEKDKDFIAYLKLHESQE